MKAPARPKAEDDKASLADLHQASLAVKAAEEALKAAMVGQGPRLREAFVFNVGFARGRLLRVASRIYAGGEFGPDDELLKGEDDAP